LRAVLVKSQIGQAQYRPALALLDELLQSHTDKPELWALQANVYVQQEQPNKAAVNLEILRKSGKANAQNLNLLGDIYLSRDNKDLALAAYQEAMAKEPGQNTARALKAAEILVNRGAWNEAKQLFSTITEAAGGSLDATDELKLLKLRARSALAQGEGSEAIKVLEGILEKNPMDGEALLLAGDYYARNEQPERAEFRYEAAAKISGFEADAFVKHAQLLVQSQKYDRAIELLRNAQKVRPRDNVQRYLEKLEQVALTAAKS
jgi:tetratricopeptide (TPR) repeat protein